MATPRALMPQREMARAARVAKREGVAVSVELPDGTRFTFGASTSAAVGKSNGFDEAL